MHPEVRDEPRHGVRNGDQADRMNQYGQRYENRSRSQVCQHYAIASKVVVAQGF
jgi:hypothetical protein